MASAFMTIYGQEIWLNCMNDSLFKDLTFPEGIDKDIAVDTIIEACGEFSALYTDPEFNKEMITLWGKRWALTFSKWVAGFAAEFSPIDNYDRSEEYSSNEGSENKTIYGRKDTTTFGKKDTTTFGKKITTTFGKTTTDTNEVSAYDSSTYQPNQKTTTTTANSDSDQLSGSDSVQASGSDSVQLSGSDTDIFEKNYKHSSRIHGNIGISTSTDVLQKWTEFYNQFNIYELIADAFVTHFCIMVY